MTRPRVSVIVASFNALDTIEGCLSALQRQECDDPFEVVVIDSSSDGTANVARRFPGINLHTFADRKFPGEARNLGAARSEGEILAFTDADCVPDPHCAAPIVSVVIEGYNEYLSFEDVDTGPASWPSAIRSIASRSFSWAARPRRNGGTSGLRSRARSCE